MRSAGILRLKLRPKILDLKPGTRVPQDDIARVLGVSRIPVREALIALEREGWVTIEMHRGAFVNALDEQAARDTYELFGLVYGFAVRRANGRASLRWRWPRSWVISWRRSCWSRWVWC